MRHGRVAQRYAEALLRAAIDGKAEEAVTADLMSLKETIEGSRDLRLLLKSPVIKRARKQEVLRSIFEGKVHATTMGFLDLVAGNGREDALDVIIDRFLELRNDRLGVLKVRVTAGTELSDEQQKALQSKFADLTRKTITMDVSVDPSLMGGFLARVGDTVFDGTIKRQLQIMRQRFLEGNGTN